MMRWLLSVACATGLGPNAAAPDAESPGARDASPVAGPDDEPEAEPTQDGADVVSDPATEPADASDGLADPPAEEPSRGQFQPRSRFAPTRPVPEYDPDSGVPPGGYWAPGEAPEIPPPDGEFQLITAYILLPLAALTTASGAANLWLTMPGQCPRRLRYVGLDATTGECRSLLVLNAIRTTYGALGVVTGFVLLGVGLHRKKQYELWKKSRFRASLQLQPLGGGFKLRF